MKSLKTALGVEQAIGSKRLRRNSSGYLCEAGILCILSVMMLYSLYDVNLPSNPTQDKKGTNIFLACILGVSLWGLIRLDHTRKLYPVYCNYTLEVKAGIIKMLPQKMNLSIMTNTANYFELMETGFLRNCSIVILIDAEGFYINVLDTKGLNSWDISFGLRRQTRAIANEIHRLIE